MNGRTRKLGFAGFVIGACFVFGVGFTSAQAPTRHPLEVVHHVSSTSDFGPAGDSGCGGDGGAASTPSPTDL